MDVGVQTPLLESAFHSLGCIPEAGTHVILFVGF